MDELNRLAESLQSVHHFKHLNPVDLITIVSAGQIRHFQADEVIFHEDQPCAGMHVLIIGEVHLKKTGPHGQTGILAIIKPVIMFNEVTVLDGGTNRSAHMRRVIALSGRSVTPHFNLFYYAIRR